MLLVWSCAEKENPIPPPVASFNFTVTRDVVSFENISENAAEYQWDFGDGNSSEEEKPMHTYAETGEYKVILAATNTEGKTDAKTSVVVVNDIPSAPMADFTFVISEKTITFINTTTGEPTLSFTWDFGDGSPISTEKNPVPVYVDYGTYTVILTASNAVGATTSEQEVQVIAPPIATSTSKTSGKTIIISNTSVAATSYEWDFGDGNSSTEKDPSHTYATTGIYTVSLTASNTGGSHSVSHQYSYYSIDGDFSDWANVPVLLTGDGGAVSSGGNGTIVEIKATSDSDSIYFFYKSTNPIDVSYTPYWRINTDNDTSTGWAGFYATPEAQGYDMDFGTTADHAWLSRWNSNTDAWDNLVSDYDTPHMYRQFADNKYEGAVSRKEIGVVGNKITFMLVDRTASWSNTGYGPATNYNGLNLDLLINE